jgi:hypothetical protein
MHSGTNRRTGAPGRPKLRATGLLGTRMGGRTERGVDGDHVEVLTGGGGRRRRPDFEEDGSGQPWGPARASCGGGVLALLRPREDATEVRLDVLELMVAMASSGSRRARRIGRRRRTGRRRDSMTGGGASRVWRA